MMTIVSTKENPKKEGQGFVRFDDNTEAWTPELAKVLPLVGKELPGDWTLKDGPHGKQLLPPRDGKGAPAAFRNTKEGFLAEAEGRLRWQQVEEERRDRRTALMQAVELWQSKPEFSKGSGITLTPTHWMSLADEMYAWLRQNVGEGAPESAMAPGLDGKSPSPATTSSSTDGEAAGLADPVEPTPGNPAEPEGKQAEDPSGSPPATPEQYEHATAAGLTATKIKALAKSVGIDVEAATFPTAEQLDRTIARYLEMQEKKAKAS